MILGIIIGAISCLFIFLIIGMYLKITEKLDQLINGVYYLVKREKDFEEAELEMEKEEERKLQRLNQVGVN